MSRLNHDQYYLQMLRLVAARSTCIRRSVGAIIVGGDGQVLATGYNGVPRDFDHCIDQPCPGADDEKGDTRRCLAVHAEVNAILQCSRLDLAEVMYVSCSPCFECAKMICNTRIRRVVSLEDYPGDASVLFKNAGIKLTVIKY